MYVVLPLQCPPAMVGSDPPRLFFALLTVPFLLPVRLAAASPGTFFSLFFNVASALSRHPALHESPRKLHDVHIELQWSYLSRLTWDIINYYYLNIQLFLFFFVLSSLDPNERSFQK